MNGEFTIILCGPAGRPYVIDISTVTIYSYNMSQYEKLLRKAIANPNGLSFPEFQTLMAQCGWIKDRQRGSHQIWYSPDGVRLSVQTRKAMAKGYQVRQFLRSVKEEIDDKR
jgi:predicted RNA binding protein YcfA (HicA-like mRNA interferase family)